MARRGWRRLIPFPRRATLARWFPSFETRNIVHLIGRSRADLVVDAGANEGQYGRRIRSAGCRLPLLSIEPLAGPHARLAARAAGDPLWQVAPAMALGPREGRIAITRYADDTLSSALPPHPRAAGSPALAPEATEAVAMRPLDAVLAELAPAAARPFVKLDLQGYELEAMAGAEATLARAGGVQVELPLMPGYAGEPGWLALLAALDRLGFTPVYCCRVVARRRLGPWLQMDVVALRPEDV